MNTYLTPRSKAADTLPAVWHVKMWMGPCHPPPPIQCWTVGHALYVRNCDKTGREVKQLWGNGHTKRRKPVAVRVETKYLYLLLSPS